MAMHSKNGTLLVYENFASGQFGQDVRDVVEAYPATARICVLAPYLNKATVASQIEQSTGPIRVGAAGPQLSLLSFDPLRKAVVQESLIASGWAETVTELPRDVQDSWLFDLFHRNRALVRAPEGIHFGKTSGKHSQYFLRGSNCVTSSVECSLIAFFLMPFAAQFEPRIIFVDTGPLASVAQALARACVASALWTSFPSVESFGSYDGLDVFLSSDPEHIVLISASTSGGLEQAIVERTGSPGRVGTLFYLQATGHSSGTGFRLADLTARDTVLTGYEPVETYVGTDSCKWCREGLPFAEFEGDQFLLQQRRVEKINVAYTPKNPSSSSLKQEAKSFFELTKSKGVFSTRLTGGGSHGYYDVQVDMPRLLSDVPEMLRRLEDVIRPWDIPVPVDLLVAEAPGEREIHRLNPFSANPTPFRHIASYSTVQQVPPIPQGTAFVSLGLVDSLHEPRKINEILRSVTANGRTGYAAILTMVDSPEAYKQLSNALRTGARGQGAFQFDSGFILLFRKRTGSQSIWEREKQWLQALVEQLEAEEVSVSAEISARLDFLSQAGSSKSHLFWPGQNGQELRLQSDFVFLSVNGRESQADVYAIVSNLLATAIQRNRDPRKSPSGEDIRLAIRDTIYSEAVLDGNNLLKYNDAVLRAAFIRAANSSELNYSRELETSSALASLIDHEISEWRFGRGQVLPEFIAALKTRHLKLCDHHTRDVFRVIERASSFLPLYIRQLASAFPGYLI